MAQAAASGYPAEYLSITALSNLFYSQMDSQACLPKSEPLMTRYREQPSLTHPRYTRTFSTHTYGPTGTPSEWRRVREGLHLLSQQKSSQKL